MKKLKFNLGDSDIGLEIPDDIDANRQELFAFIGIELQELIANGVVPVHGDRIWPCLYCGKILKTQGKLSTHLETHNQLKERMKDKLSNIYKKEKHE